MSVSDCRRWEWLFDRRTLEEELTKTDKDFYESHLSSCSQCGREANSWANLRDHYIGDNDEKLRRQRDDIAVGGAIADVMSAVDAGKVPCGGPSRVVNPRKRAGGRARVALVAGVILGMPLLAAAFDLIQSVDSSGANDIHKNGGALQADSVTASRHNGKLSDESIPKKSDSDLVDNELEGVKVKVFSNQASPTYPTPNLSKSSAPVLKVAKSSSVHRSGMSLLGKQDSRQIQSLAASPLPSAGKLLALASRERAGGRLARAAKIYAQLQARFPSSSIARATLISSGDIARSLGSAQSALEYYERYLSSGGGALSSVARSGKIRALQSLGRVSEERALIVQELKTNPNGSRAKVWRRRLKVLHSED